MNYFNGRFKSVTGRGFPGPDGGPMNHIIFSVLLILIAIVYVWIGSDNDGRE